MTSKTVGHGNNLYTLATSSATSHIVANGTNQQSLAYPFLGRLEELGLPSCVINLSTSQPRGTIIFTGAGRDATKIVGTNDYGYIVGSSTSDCTGFVGNFTARNNSVLPDTGAFTWGVQVSLSRVENCRFVGFNGFWWDSNPFGCNLQSIICECVVPPGPANAATPEERGPPAGSVGMVTLLSELSNCSVHGFDIGFCGQGIQLQTGCSAHGCNSGFALVRGNPQAGRTFWQGGFMGGNFVERCRVGFDFTSVSGAVLGGNAVIAPLDTSLAASSGPAEPAEILAMQWLGGTTVRVTTLFPHNLDSNQKLSLKTDPSGYVPADGLVDATVLNSTQFTYPWTTDPGSVFVSGTWNYPVYACFSIPLVSGHGFTSTLLAGNAATAPCSHASCDFGGFNVPVLSQIMCMEAPYGWTFPTGGDQYTGQVVFESCSGVNPPVPKNKFASLEGFVGIDNMKRSGVESTVVDAPTENNFGGIISSGGGSNHYKVRYDGAAWRRVA